MFVAEVHPGRSDWQGHLWRGAQGQGECQQHSLPIEPQPHCGVRSHETDHHGEGDRGLPHHRPERNQDPQVTQPQKHRQVKRGW